jgi:hypothetical protein
MKNSPISKHPSKTGAMSKMSSHKRNELIQAKREADLARLSEPARRLYDQVRAGTENAHRVAQALWEMEYERKPVGLREFVEDEYYLGKIMKGDIFPKIVDDLEELFDGQYTDVILTGSIGWGKTRFMEIAVAYDLYKVSCLKDPARAYGMMKGSNITFVNVSVNKTQATKVFFQDLYDLLSASPYFQKEFPFDRRVKSEIRFLKNNIRCYPVAASEQAALGVGVFCACIDEANFMEVVERSKRTAPGMQNLYDQAAAVHHKLSTRMRGRMSVRGRLPGHIYVASSARYPDDFTERLEKQAREEAAKGEHYMFVRHYAQWETWPPEKFTKESFQVEVGDLTRRTRVLTGEETDVSTINVITVPMTFKRDFDHDPDLAVRDVGGKSVLSIRPFISRRELIRRMFEMGEQAGLKHPFTKFEVTLQQKDPAMERLLPENLHWVNRPKLNQYGRPVIGNDGKPETERRLFDALHHCHVDLSKTGDATGIVIAHNVGARKIQRFDPKSMQNVEELKPVIWVDLALRIVAPRHEEIDIPRIRAILYELNRRYKMEFGKVTFDTYGSQESVKTMHDEGFNTDILSVDKDNTPYETLRTAIYDERILCYYSPVLERELIQLERGPKKIDHPPRGSKDLADALAGAVQHCEEGWRAGESSRGLFQFGVVERPGEPTPEMQARRDVISEKIASGHKLTNQEEDDLLFGDLGDFGGKL